MSFNNLLVAVALTVLWPLGLMGVLAAAEWLERRTLAAGDVAPRRPRSAGALPDPVQAEAIQATVVGEDAGVAAASWPAGAGGSPGGAQGPMPPDGRSEAADGERLAARRAGGGGRHLRRAGGGGGRHERRG
jgi:hypothetical protein